MSKVAELEIFARGLWVYSVDTPPTDWCEEHIELSRLESDVPGPFSSALTPFMREPLDCFGGDGLSSVTLVFGSQVVKTLLLMLGTAFRLATRTGRVMWVMDTVDNARSFSENRWIPLVDNCPELKELKPSNPDMFKKLEQHIGGSLLNFVGSNSAGNLASRPADLVLMDEVDKFPQQLRSEGDAVDLVEQRTKSRGRSLVVKTSTPTDEDGLIWREYKAGDQRKYFVPCPHCGEFQILEFANIQWDQGAREGDEWDLERVGKSAAYICPKCEGRIMDGHKTRMLRDGEWRATSTDGRPGARSYHLSSLYSPWVKTSFGALAVQFLSEKRKGKIRGFLNGYLAEPERVNGERIDAPRLMLRKESYRADIPEGVGVLTVGCDVQDDRIEAELVGWGAGEESWSLGYQVFDGDPARRLVWGDLDAWLGEKRDLNIGALAIDSGGHYTHETYAWVRENQPRRWYAIKGASQPGRPIVGRPGKRNRQGVRLVMVGTDTAKATIFSRFKITERGPGYCHFPDHYDEEYFLQLAGEEQRTKYRRGFEVKEWHKIRERNEALDCRVYAYAALCLLPRLSIKQGLEHRAEAVGAVESSEEVRERPRAPRRKRNNWATKW